MSILAILKIAAGDVPLTAEPPAGAAPVQVAQPNPVNAPTVVNVESGGGGGGGGSMFPIRHRMSGRVRPSAPTGNSPQYQAKPLTPGPMIPQNGQLVSPEEAQANEMMAAEAAAEAEKSKKPEQKPAVQDTPVNDHLVSSWMQRVKRASNPGFLPLQTFPGGGSMYTDPGRSGFQGGYNPFEAGSGMNKVYSTLKGMFTGNLRSLKPQHWMTTEMRRNPQLPYVQALARNLADPVAVGSSTNPLFALGMNLLQSKLKGTPVQAPSAEDLESLVR